jgi:hypothetical protein
MSGKLNLTDVVDRFQFDFQDKLNQKTKEFREMYENVNGMKLTNEILIAILKELQRLNIADDFEGDIVMSVNAVFGPPYNKIPYDEFNYPAVKSTLEKYCKWIVLDTDNKHFVIKNKKAC